MSKAAELAALIANVNNGSSLGNKNLIINGAMNVAQRGSATGATSSGYKSVDRFRPSIGTAGTWTITQSTDVPTGQGFASSLKFDCTTANSSLSAGSDMALQYRFEGQDVQTLRKGTSSAVSVTISFWVKSTKTGTFICELKDDDNSRQISQAYTISSSNTWEKKELTFAGDTTGTLDDDNAKSLTILWWQVAGTNFTSGTLNTSWAGSVSATNRAVGQVNIADSTSNDWLITGVQMEIGEKATEFEHEPYERTVNRCFRYFNRITGYNCREFPGYNENTTKGLHVFRFPVKMRNTPTIGVSGTASNYIIAYSNTQTACSSAVVFNTTNLEGVTFYSTVSSGLTAGQASCLRNIDDIDLIAEL